MKRKTSDLPVTMWDESDATIAEFRKMVSGGMSPKLAEMLACRQAPGADTDDVFYSGLKPLAESFGKAYHEQTYAQAKAAGITVSDNCHYNATFADERGGGDPDAWIRVGEGRKELKARLRAKGTACKALGIEKNDRLIENEMKREAKINKKKRQSARV